MHVAQLPELESLNLAGCAKITVAGLVVLSQLNKLEKVNLENCTKITGSGVRRTPFIFICVTCYPRL